MSIARAFFCYFCAIAILWIINNKQCHFLFHLYTSSRLVCDFPKHSGSNWQEENLGFLYIFFLFIMSCVSNHSCVLWFFFFFFHPQTPQPHLNHTHLLSLQSSIPNRLTGLWQKMLVDLLGAPHSSGACLTCIFLERHLAPSRVSQVSSWHKPWI